MIQPCNFDHNGECLICDCWLADCAFQRLLNQDFTYETQDQLLEMFKTHLTEEKILQLKNRQGCQNERLPEH